MIEFRTPYNYDTNKVSDETGLECLDASKAVQSQKEEADINTIVRRFGLTGQLPQNARMPEYGDFTGITDYQSALNAVMAADDTFMQMPADVRVRFGNDPEKFVQFCLDPANAEEAVKLGLAVKKAQVEPTGTPVGDTGASAAGAGTPAPMAAAK